MVAPFLISGMMAGCARSGEEASAEGKEAARAAPPIAREAAAASPVSIPGPADWREAGVALAPGPPGAWDVRLSGAISPAAAVEKDGTTFLYYIGADGDRSTDGGPRHRALGVATSRDGVRFEKHPKNPIMTHLPHGNEEEGIFSAAAVLDRDGSFLLYYAALDAGSRASERVRSDIRLARSEDGVAFTDLGVALSHRDRRVWGYGDELFPLGALQGPEGWLLYYLAKGKGGVRWDLGAATGGAAGGLERTRAALRSRTDVAGGIGPIELGPDSLAVFLVRRETERGFVEVRTAGRERPEVLSQPVQTYRGDVRHLVALLDRPRGRWLLYVREGRDDTIRTRVAPAGGTGR